MKDKKARKKSTIVEKRDSLEQKLGRRIQDLRLKQRLTLEKLAEFSGVSRAMLSQIERGEKNPTVSVAVKIAKALGVNLFHLIGESEEHRKVKILPKEQQLSIKNPATNFEQRLLSPTFENRHLEIMRHLIPEKIGSGDLPPSHKGVEKYLIVEKGKLKVTLDGETYLLAQGDAMYFEGNVPHRYENAGRGVCSYLIVVSSKN